MAQRKGNVSHLYLTRGGMGLPGNTRHTQAERDKAWKEQRHRMREGGRGKVLGLEVKASKR